MADLSLEVHVSYSLFLILQNACNDIQEDNLLGHHFSTGETIIMD